MGDGHSRAAQKDEYVAVIDQDQVTEEVRDIAINYDPLNRSGRGEGFHLTEDGELHIEDEFVIEEHSIVANKIPNDAIQIVRLPAERGELLHQYGENGFRLYELPAPVEDRVVGVLGPNGVGKSTALRVLAGTLQPNLGRVDDEPDWDEVVREFRGTAVQRYLEDLRDGTVSTAYKPQRVDRLADRYEGTVRDLIAERDERDVGKEAIELFDLAHVADRTVGELSGGELQRVAVAATLVADVDTYLIDEPSSYLDVGQRLTVARALSTLAEDRQVLVVDHDLVTLDVVADSIHVVYGDPGAFGVVSRPLSARRGINQFLGGTLEQENVRIRETEIDFVRRARRREPDDPPVLEFPELRKSFEGESGTADGDADAGERDDAEDEADGGFSLRVESGAVYPDEVLGILGRNGLGKTTFAKLLAGSLEPDDGDLETTARISYKPQYLDSSFDGTVEELLASEVDIYSQAFRRDVRDPFDLEPLYEQRVPDLSGGELQRVGIGLALARDADAYLLDEPSAYLDVEQRTSFAAALRGFVNRTDAPCMVIDHDLLLLDYVSDRAMVFEGESGAEGVGRSPQPVRDGIDRFLEGVGVTFREDPNTGRPRANKPGSQKDREQKSAEEWYAL